MPVLGRSGLRRRVEGSFPARVARRYVAIGGYDRALALATQSFVAVVPMLIVVAAALPLEGRPAAQALLVGSLQLSGTAATELQQLVQRPPDAAEPVTLVGAALLVVSVLGFTRTLQRTYLAAWHLPPLGLLGYARGLAGAAALVGGVVGVVVVGEAVRDAPGAEVLAPAVRLVLSILLWWPVPRLLLGDRIPWRRLLPGAVLAGTGQVLVLTLSGFYLQPAIESQAQRYGLIGVAFVLVTWLIGLGLLLVLSAVVGAVLGADVDRDGGPVLPGAGGTGGHPGGRERGDDARS